VCAAGGERENNLVTKYHEDTGRAVSLPPPHSPPASSLCVRAVQPCTDGTAEGFLDQLLRLVRPAGVL